MIKLQDIILEPSIVLLPSFCKCPLQDCEERGKHTYCYLKKDYESCNKYLEGFEV